MFLITLLIIIIQVANQGSKTDEGSKTNLIIMNMSSQYYEHVGVIFICGRDMSVFT